MALLAGTPRRRFEVGLGVPATEGNELTVLRNGDEIFPAMLDAIRGARRTVDFLTFVYWAGDIAIEFADALARRAERGARVRVLLDAFGSRTMDPELIERMLDAGCKVELFRPVGEVTPTKADHRTHRKILVCDERVAFTGGVGIAEEWCGDARDESEWRDTHIRVRGPAVDGLRAAFNDNWVRTSHDLLDGVDGFEDQPAPGGSVVQVLSDGEYSDWSTTAKAFTVLMDGAQHHLRLCTAYFTPDEQLMARLEAASSRGVHIQVLVPGEHADKAIVRWAGEATYQRLLDADVEIRTFDPSMLHAKVMCADGEVAIVGSSNVNSRSVSHDDEVLLVVFDPQVVGLLESQFDEDVARSTRLDPADWAERGVLARARERAVEVVSDLM